jgi:hypothetical protein
VDNIIRYFGKDFLIKPGKRMSPLLVYGDSYGDSRDPIQITYLISYVILERETGFEGCIEKLSIIIKSNSYLCNSAI